jgi:superfamily II DNA or RNA helicase
MSFALTLSAPLSLHTSKGLRLVRKAKPTKEFWAAWRNSKDSLRELGYSVRKVGSEWEVLQYHTPDDASIPEEISPVILNNTQILYDYQIKSAGYLCASLIKHGSALDGSDTGTGKTPVSFAVARQLNHDVAILCPKSVIPSWERWAEKFRVKPIFVINYEQCKTEKFRFGHFDQYGNYVWKLNKQNTLLIFDEAHKCKGEYTQNSSLLIGARKSRIPMLLLSATIATNPREMKASGYALGLHALDDFRAWSIGKGCYQNNFNGWDCANPQEAMKKISPELFPMRGYRVRIADLGDAFPDTQITAEMYDTGTARIQNEQYDFLIEEIKRLKAEKKAGYTAAILTLNLRYRQNAEIRKIGVLTELAKDALEENLSVVIFVNFTETLIALEKNLKNSVTIHGQQSGEERQASVDAFQADKARVIICNVQAGGVGLSLHDLNGKHPRIAFLCPTYGAINLKQALGRVHRAGGLSKSLQRLVYAKGTIEEEICVSVSRKLDNISALNDGDLMEPDIFKLMGAPNA